MVCEGLKKDERTRIALSEKIFNAIPKMTEAEKNHFLNLAKEIRKGSMTGINTQDFARLDDLIKRETNEEDE